MDDAYGGRGPSWKQNSRLPNLGSFRRKEMTRANLTWSTHGSSPNPSCPRGGNGRVGEEQGELELPAWALGLPRASRRRLGPRKNYLSSIHVQCRLGKRVIMEGAFRRVRRGHAAWCIPSDDLQRLAVTSLLVGLMQSARESAKKERHDR